jgi:DNA repair exonuclease SbcCD nuclease subunit
MKVMVVNDIHASAYPPSSCTDSYNDDLMNLLAQTAVLARERSCGAVVWAGDIFHHKAPSRVPHWLVLKLIHAIRAYPCPVWIVPGNHDLQHDRLDSIHESQPLGVLLAAGARKLDGRAYDENGQRYLALYGVPWQQKWTEEAVEDALAAYRLRPDASLIVTHAPLYPPGKELQFEYYPATQFADAMGGGSGYVAYGHVHEPHGVWRCETAAGTKTFCNNGALSRGSLHEYNLTRQVGVTLWDSETCEFEFVPLDAKPADQVFRLREKAEVTDMAGRLNNFLEGISHTSLEAVNIESVMERMRASGADDPTLSLAAELLAHASAAAK